MSSSATTTHSKYHPMNIIFIVLFVSTMGWTISCMTCNSSCNTHSSSCSYWKSFAYNNSIFNRIHHSRKRHWYWATLVEPVLILISLIRNPDACSDATQVVHISKLKPVVNISMSSFRYLQKRRKNIKFIMLSKYKGLHIATSSLHRLSSYNWNMYYIKCFVQKKQQGNMYFQCKKIISESITM